MEQLPLSNNILWRVRLFDGPRLETLDGVEIARFKSQRVGALLAYLALKLGHPCPREELAYALWPDEEDMPAVSNRLRVALSSLRRQLEPPGTPFGSVLDVSHPACIRLRAETVWCDYIAIEQALKAGKDQEAARLLQGEFLPNYYDEWAVLHHHRFAMLREDLERLPPVPEPFPFVERRQDADINTAFLLNAPRYPLPLYLTNYYGREAEKERLLTSLCKNRLVTAVGTGGIGKTRLAVEVTIEMRITAVFVPLADIETSAALPETILHALKALPSANTDLVEQVIAALDRQGSPLLILDNAERILESVAELTMRLLEVLPDLHILVTSRQRLDILGETLLPLPSLESPVPDLPYETLIELPAVALFLDRARAVLPDFQLNARNISDIAGICRQLEGLPLAIELAAVRVTQQTPSQITADLANNLLILKSRQRGLSKRHQSLRATMQGSYDLLSSDQQEFFAAMSVFQGGWTAEAAYAVNQNSEAEDFLYNLISRSLIVAKEDTEKGGIRYSFLESIRQFAAEHIPAEKRLTLTANHSDYFLKLASAVWEDDIRTMTPLDGERENLLMALDRGWELQDAEFYYGLIGAFRYLIMHGQHRIAMPWVVRASSKVAFITDATIRSRLFDAIIRLLIDTGKVEESRRIAQEMLELAEASGDLSSLVSASIKLGYIENELGNFERAVQMQRESLEQSRHLNDSSLLKESLAMTARAINCYGCHLGAETDSGRAAFEEALALQQECRVLLSPHSRFLSHNQLSSAISYLNLNRGNEGYAALKEAQQTALAHDAKAILMYAFYHESFTALETGHFKYAALLHGAFRDIQERIGYSMPINDDDLQSFQSDLIERLGKDAFDAMVQLGRRTPPRDLVNYTLDNLPSILHEEGAPSGTRI